MADIKYHLYNILGSFAVGDMIKRIKNNSPKSVDEIIEFIFSFDYMGLNIKPIQDQAELRAFLNILKEQDIHNFLEIGTAKGGTFFAFSHVIADDALMLSLDWENARSWKSRLIKSLAASPKQKVLTFSGDSHSMETFGEISAELGFGKTKLDFLFIDGDHSYQGVKTDFEIYSKLIRKGGLVAFHDIANPAYGCHEYYYELAKRFKHSELVAGEARLGIGILYL